MHLGQNNKTKKKYGENVKKISFFFFNKLLLDSTAKIVYFREEPRRNQEGKYVDIHF